MLQAQALDVQRNAKKIHLNYHFFSLKTDFSVY